MPHRRIEITAGQLDSSNFQSILDEVEAVDRQALPAHDDTPPRYIFLVEEKHTESIIDHFEDQYGHTDGFHMGIYDVAALLPRPKETAGDRNGEDGDGQENENGNGKDSAASKPKRRRVSREELLDDLAPGSRIDVVYIAQVLISCVVAAAGMIRDSVALVIAAMVIAPLLLPNMSLALGTTLGDLSLIRRSLIANVAGMTTGLLLAILMGLLLTIDPDVTELAIRSEVSYSDLIVAVAAGDAGALAVTTGVAANLIGVMVAVALVPPLVAVGLFLGDGQFTLAGHAAILLSTNVVCVNLSAVVVFLLQGIRPNRWYEEEKAKKATRTLIATCLVILAVLVLLIWIAAPENPLTETP